LNKNEKIHTTEIALCIQNGGCVREDSFEKVRLAQSERHLATVAISIINKEELPKDYVKKFLPRQMRIIRTLNHPHIVSFLQVFIAMLFQFAITET